MNKIKIIIFSALLVIPQIVFGQYLEAPPVIDAPENGYNKDLNQYELSQTWYNDKIYYLYSFSEMNELVTSDLYVITETAEISSKNINFVIGKIPSDKGYSDFFKVKHLIAENPQDFKSVEDIENSDLVYEDMGIVINAPVVVEGSTLEDPVNIGEAADIVPIKSYYKGQIVSQFVFDSSDESFAEVLNKLSRTSEFAPPVNVVPALTSLKSDPMYFFNFISNQVKPSLNSGGPWKQGQRNVLHAVVEEDNYSPIKELYIIKQLPLGYMINNVSSFNDINADDFKYDTNGLYLNQPQLGWKIDPELREENLSKNTDFKVQLVEDHFELVGAVPGLSGSAIKALANDIIVAVADTNKFGGYTLKIPVTYLDKPIKIMSEDLVVATYPFDYKEPVISVDNVKIPNYWMLIVALIIAILGILVLSQLLSKGKR